MAHDMYRHDRRRRPLEVRFWEKVNKSGPTPLERPDLGSCWQWLAATAQGYGAIGTGVGNQTRRAHRIAYEMLIGPIPDTLVLDHLCRNRGCVRPTHLEPVTQQVNNQRGYGWSGRNGRKTHCPQGHAYTYDTTWRDHLNRRFCLVCTPGRGVGTGTGAWNRSKTHCPQGHPLSGDNLYQDPRGTRGCKTCRRESGQRIARARKGEGQAIAKAA